MSNQIHPTAVISEKAELGNGNVIGPNVVIEDGVKIGDDNKVGPAAVFFKGAEVGDNNLIHTGAIIGDDPQDLSYDGSDTFLKIGNGNRIREYCTIHRGAKEGSVTEIGDNCFFMGYTHIAHNCKIGSGVISVNNAVFGGHVQVEDNAFVSANTAIHQFARVGKFAMISGLSAVTQDVPPYFTCGGRIAKVFSLNVVGLRRGGVSPAARKEIKTAYKILYRSGLSVANAVEQIKAECSCAEVDHLVQFIENSKRGIAKGGSSDEVR